MAPVNSFATLRKDYFPYAVQATSVDSVTIYASNGGKLVSISLPNAPDAINLGFKNGGSAILDLPADTSIMVRTLTQQVFVALLYQFGASP